MLITQIVEEVPAKFVEVVKAAGEGAQFVRKVFVRAKGYDKDYILKEGERAEIGYISTNDKDLDDEILMPGGCDLSYFNEHKQVIWGHDYQIPPIGTARWIKKDEHGVLAKTWYAETERAEEIWQLVKSGVLKTFSVGFVPIKATWQGADDWEKTCDKLHEQGMTFDRTKVRRIYTKWTLLEYSKVSIPSNVHATTIAVAKGMKLSDDLLAEMGIDKTKIERARDEIEKTEFTCECIECGHTVQTDKHCVDIECPECGGEMRRAERPGEGRSLTGGKAVIPYADHGAAPENADWDGPAEVREADAEDMKIICTWYDKDNADVKGAYKLPHHRATGRHAAVWRGVAAAMGALLGGRGGVDIPDGNKRGCYNHLKQHYAAWEKEPPEFREYPEAELKILFAEVWDDVLYLKHPTLRPDANEHACQLTDSGEYERTRRQDDKFGKGIHALYGIKGSDAELHAIRFDDAKFTVAQARKWCDDNDHKSILLFEPAASASDKELRELDASVEVIAQPIVEPVEEPVKPKKIYVEVVKAAPIVEMVERELGRRLGKV